MPEDRAPIDYASPVARAKRVTNVWATLGCVLAIGFLLPPVAIAGAIASWIGLRRSADPNVGGRRAALIGLWFGIIGIAIVPVEYLGLCWAREQAAELRCRNQILAIATSIPMYVNGNNGNLPPDLATFAAWANISPSVFVCMASTDHEATSFAQMATPGHVSYIYLGHGQRLDQVKNPATEVMLYELPNHFGGFHVAFYDGHVEFVPRRKASKILAELKAGQNPPPSLTAP